MKSSTKEKSELQEKAQQIKLLNDILLMNSKQALSQNSVIENLKKVVFFHKNFVKKTQFFHKKEAGGRKGAYQHASCEEHQITRE